MNRRLTRILAATDGGPSGRLAVVRAASIARETGAELHAVHVVDPSEESTDLASADRGLTETELRRHLARIRPRPRIHRRHGATFVEIIRLARSLDVDLIVAGAHRGPSARRFFLGTTAGRIARHGDRPLLLVRRPVRGHYRRVMVGVDASSASRDAVVAAHAVAPTATIVPTMIYRAVGEAKLRPVARKDAIAEFRAEVARQHRQELTEFLATHAPDIPTEDLLLTVGDPSQRLPQLPAERHCDLIAVGTHGRTGVRFALLGSVAEHVLRDTDRDVLLARRSASIPHPT